VHDAQDPAGGAHGDRDLVGEVVPPADHGEAGGTKMIAAAGTDVVEARPACRPRQMFAAVNTSDDAADDDPAEREFADARSLG
jgi:hypothetical protein